MNLHLLPYQTRLIKSNKKFLALIGGTGCGKCGRFNVHMADGSVRFIAEVNPGDQVLSLDETNYKLTPARVTNRIYSGLLPVYRVFNDLGSYVDVSNDHPFLAFRDNRPQWVETRDLRPGDYIARPASHDPGKASHKPAMMALLGYLLGDGGMTNTEIRFTNKEPKIIAHMKLICGEFDCRLVKRGLNRAKHGYAIISNDENPRLGSNMIRDWVTSLGLNKKSIDKEIPAFVFTLRNKYIAPLLNALFACDGWVDAKGEIGYCSSSEKMACQVHKLLLRFGIIAGIRYRAVKYRKKIKDTWIVDIKGSPSRKIFKEQIGILSKDHKIKINKGANHNNIYPFDSKKYAYKHIPREKLSGQGGGVMINGERYKFSDKAGADLLLKGIRNPDAPTISRARLVKIAEYFQDDRLLALLDGQIEFQRVKKIKPMGQLPCWDLEIEGTHNFVADDFIVHNTYLAPIWLYLKMLEFPGEDWIVSAPTRDDLKRNPLKYIRRFFDEHDLRYELNKADLKMVTNFGTVYFISAETPERMQGIHAKGVIGDEAGLYDQLWFETAIQRIALKRGQMLLVTTPYSVNWLKTKVWDQGTAGKRDYHLENPISLDNPYYPKDEYYRAKRELPRWKFEMFFDARFPKEGKNSVFNQAAIFQAMQTVSPKSVERDHIVLTVDIARTGNDNIIMNRWDGMEQKEIMEYPKMKLNELKGEIVNNADEMVKDNKNWPTVKDYKDFILVVDETGMGKGVADDMPELGFNVIGVDFTSNAEDRQFANKRAELYFMMAESLDKQETVLLYNDFLIEDCLAQQFKFNSKGQLLIIPKDDIRKKLGRSPDYSDAAMLRWAVSKHHSFGFNDRFTEEDAIMRQFNKVRT